ncbi:hypothetical protein ACFFRR_007379 [Megaselia abdita]
MSRKRHISEQNPCSNCYPKDHAHSECTSFGPISCLKCYRLNVQEDSCNCQNRCKSPPCQTLRLVGKKHSPRWYVDLKIHNRNFAALVNSTIERGRVSAEFANWLHSVTKEGQQSTSSTIDFKLTWRDLILQITCDISEHQKEEIHIGTDLMMYLGYTFSMDGIVIDSTKSYIASNPYEINYLYNLPGEAEELRSYLQEKAVFLKQTRTVNDHYGVPTLPKPPKRVVIITRALSISSSEDDK